MERGIDEQRRLGELFKEEVVDALGEREGLPCVYMFVCVCVCVGR